MSIYHKLFRIQLRISGAPNTSNIYVLHLPYILNIFSYSLPFILFNPSITQLKYIFFFFFIEYCWPCFIMLTIAQPLSTFSRRSCPSSLILNNSASASGRSLSLIGLIYLLKPFGGTVDIIMASSTLHSLSLILTNISFANASSLIQIME